MSGLYDFYKSLTGSAKKSAKKQQKKKNKTQTKKRTKSTGTSEHRGGSNAPSNQKKEARSTQTKQSGGTSRPKTSTARAGSVGAASKGSVRNAPKTGAVKQTKSGTQRFNGTGSRSGAIGTTKGTGSTTPNLIRSGAGKAYDKYHAENRNANGIRSTTQSVDYGNQIETVHHVNKRGGTVSALTKGSIKPKITTEKKDPMAERSYESQAEQRKIGKKTQEKKKQYAEEYKKRSDDAIRRQIANMIKNGEFGDGVTQENYKKVFDSVYDYVKKNPEFQKNIDKGAEEYSKKASSAYAQEENLKAQERINEKVGKAGKLESEELTNEDYLRLQNASRIGGKVGTASLGKDLAEKVGSRTAYSAGKNGISKFATGAMQGMAYADVLHGGVGTYNEDARGVLKDVKESEGYMGGYMAGFMGNFALSGINSAGRALGKSVSNVLSKEAGKELTESAAKRFTRNRVGELMAETPINIADAVKMATDENGNIDKKTLAEFLVLNSAMTVGMGGAMESAVTAGAKKKANRLISLQQKLGEREANAEEIKEIGRLKEDVRKMATDELSASAPAVRDIIMSTESKRLARKMRAKGLSEDAIKNALSKKDVNEYLALRAVGENRALTGVEKQQKLVLERKLSVARQKQDNAFAELVNETKKNIDKATAVDAKLFKTAAEHYEAVGMKAEAKEARELHSKAIKNLNNTIDAVTRAGSTIAKALKTDVKIEDSNQIIQALAQTGRRVDDPTALGGFIEKDANGNVVAIHINQDSEHALEFVLGHELTHGFESLGGYDDFAKMLKEYAGDEEWQAELDWVKSQYNDVKDADFERETIANLVGRHLFSEDSTFLDKMIKDDPSMFQKIYEFIKKLFSGEDGGIKVQDEQLEALNKKMDELFNELSVREQSIMKGNPDTSEMLHGGVRSLDNNGIDNPERGKRIQEIKSNMAQAKRELAQAKKMFGDDYKELAKTRRDIFKAYRVFEGYDGIWRYFIDDRGMKFNFGTTIKPVITDSNGEITHYINAKGNARKFKTDKEYSKPLLSYDTATGDIKSASAETYEKYVSRVLELSEDARKNKSGKLTGAKADEFNGLKTQIMLYRAFTEGVPLREMFEHNDLFTMYPELAHGTKFHIGDPKKMPDNPKWYGKDITAGMTKDGDIYINPYMFVPESNIGKYFANSGIDAIDEIKISVLHEVQHSIQKLEGFSRGGDPEIFKYAELNFYPKLEKDAKKLHTITEKNNDILERLYNIDEDSALKFRIWYNKYIDSYTVRDENGKLLGDAYDNVELEPEDFFVQDALYELDDAMMDGSLSSTKNKEFISNNIKEIEEFIRNDHKVATLAERDKQTLYEQLAGEKEARDVERNLRETNKDRQKVYDERQSLRERMSDVNVYGEQEFTDALINVFDELGGNIPRIKSRFKSAGEYVDDMLEKVRAKMPRDGVLSGEFESLARDYLEKDYELSGMKKYYKSKQGAEYPVEEGANVRIRPNEYEKGMFPNRKNQTDTGLVELLYAGERSNTANLSKLEKAMEALESGKAVMNGNAPWKTYDEFLERVRKREAENNSRAQIFRKHGWFQGVDGKWRYEIDDSKMKLKGSIKSLEQLVAKNKANGMPTYLKDIIEHDELFDAYPDAEKLVIEFENKPFDSTKGSFNGHRIMQNLGHDHYQNVSNKRKKDVLKGCLIHELQHFIQRKEGFASGANVDMFSNRRILASPEQYMEIAANVVHSQKQMLKSFSKSLGIPMYDIKLRKGFMDWWGKSNYKNEFEKIISTYEPMVKKGVEVDFDDVSRDFDLLLSHLQKELNSSFNTKIPNETSEKINQWAYHTALSRIAKTIDDAPYGTEYNQYLRIAGEQEARESQIKQSLPKSTYTKKDGTVVYGRDEEAALPEAIRYADDWEDAKAEYNERAKYEGFDPDELDAREDARKRVEQLSEKYDYAENSQIISNKSGDVLFDRGFYDEAKNEFPERLTQYSKGGDRKRASNAEVNGRKVFDDAGNVTRDAEADYRKVAEAGDMESAQKFVDAVLESKGYTIDAYHGSQTFGFTEFDPKSAKNASQHYSVGTTDDEIIVFASKSEKTAGSYAKTREVKPIQAGRESQKGIYHAKLKMDNPLTVDAKGERQGEINFSELDNHKPTGVAGAMMMRNKGYSTNEIAVWARDHGYDGVIFKNLRDSVGSPLAKKDEIYAVFSSNQFKSADPVTYRDDGSIIPLSERGSETNPDIRFAKGGDRTRKTTATEKDNFKPTKGMREAERDAGTESRTTRYDEKQDQKAINTIEEQEKYEATTPKWERDIDDKMFRYIGEREMTNYKRGRTRLKNKGEWNQKTAEELYEKVTSATQKPLKKEDGVLKGAKVEEGAKTKEQKIRESAPTLEEFVKSVKEKKLSYNEISKHLETIYNAGHFEPEEMRNQLLRDLKEGAYVKKKREPHAKAVERAESAVKADWEEAYKRQIVKVEEEDLSAYDYAERKFVMQKIEDMVRKGDLSEEETSRLVRMHRDMSINEVLNVSNKGAALNAAKIMKKMTPGGRAEIMIKKVERMNKRYKDRLKGKKLVLTEEQYQRIINAKDADEAFRIMAEISDELMAEVPSTLFEKLNEVRRFMMLANLRTHERNLIGNTFFAGARYMSDAMEIAAYRIPAVRNRVKKLGGEVDKTKLVYWNDVQKNKDFLKKEFKRVYGASGSTTQYRDVMRVGSPKAFKNKTINKILDFNYGALEKEDMIMFKPAFNRHYMEWCSSHGVKNVSEMTEKQMEQAGKYALEKAEYATFRDDSIFSRKVCGFKMATAGRKGNTPIGRIGYRAANMAVEGHLPFVKTPVNIMRRSMDYSPVGIARGIVKIGTSDNPELFKEAIHDFCTGMTGTGVAMFGGLLASQSWVTVQAGKVSGDAYYDRDMGYQDYSLVVHNPLNDHTYSVSIDWMSPMQTSLFMGAGAFEKMQEDGFTFQDFADIGVKVFNPMLDMSFMATSKDTFETFMEKVYRNGTGDNADWTGAITQTLLGKIPQGYLGSFVPQMLSQAATGSDKYQRDTRSTKEDAVAASWDSWRRQIANKFPVLREQINNPKINRFGEDKLNTGGENIVTRWLNAMANPSNMKRITLNDTDKELISIYNQIPDTDKNKKYFFYSFTGNPDYELADGGRMNYQELYRYGQEKRQSQSESIQEMFDSKSYKDMTNEMKVDEIDEYHFISQTQADFSVYKADYALQRIVGSENVVGVIEGPEKNKSYVTDEDRAGGKTDAVAWKIYKDLKGDKNKSKEEFVNFWLEKEKIIARAHDSGYETKAFACAYTGNGDLARAYDINTDKIDRAVKYVQDKGAKKAYKEFTNANCNIESGLQNAHCESRTKADRSWSAAGYNDIDEATYRAMGFDWNSAQSGAGLRQKYGYDVNQLVQMKSQAKYEFDEDKNGSLKKEETINYIESLGIDDVQLKACLFEYLKTSANTNNPYDTINDYLHWGDNADEDDVKGNGWGRGRRYGRRGGYGGRGGSGSGGTVPTTASGAINGKVTDPFGKSSGTGSKSNLDEAYRKKARKLAQQSRKRLS